MKDFLIKIKTKIKPCYILYKKVHQNLKWYFQYQKAKKEKLYSSHLTRLNLDTSKKIVILVPHADDEWIGPYSIVKQKPQHLKCIYFNLFGLDYSDNNIKIRNEEILASSNYWGYTLLNNFNYDVDLLYNEIVTAKYCFIPSPIDWHPEHRKVFQTFVQAYSRLTKVQKDSLEVYYYSVSVPHSYRDLLYFIPLTKQEVDAKWKIFPKIYLSQSFMPALRYKLQLRLVPLKVGYAAQTFIKATDDRIKKDSEMLNQANIEELLSDLSKTINNIYQVRKVEVLKNN